MKIVVGQDAAKLDRTHYNRKLNFLFDQQAKKIYIYLKPILGQKLICITSTDKITTITVGFVIERLEREGDVHLVSINLLQNIINDIHGINCSAVLGKCNLQLLWFNEAIAILVKVGEGTPQVVVICHPL